MILKQLLKAQHAKAPRTEAPRAAPAGVPLRRLTHPGRFLERQFLRPLPPLSHPEKHTAVLLPCQEKFGDGKAQRPIRAGSPGQ